MFRSILFVVACCLLAACTHSSVEKVGVSFGVRETLHFTGRGVAAGIMMDAHLGGAGVAVGIAIDEGIAKDLSAAIKKSNPEFDIRDIVKKQVVSVSDEVVMNNWQSIVIEKYGFEVVDGDFVSPVLELTVNCKGGAEKIHFERNLANSDKAELELVKKDGKIGLNLLQQAVAETMQAKHLGSLCGNER